MHIGFGVNWGIAAVAEAAGISHVFLPTSPDRLASQSHISDYVSDRRACPACKASGASFCCVHSFQKKKTRVRKPMDDHSEAAGMASVKLSDGDVCGQSQFHLQKAHMSFKIKRL